MNLVVFEDSGMRNLMPISLGRPGYAISCAGYRLIDLLAGIDANRVGSVRPHLERIQQHDFPELAPQLNQASEWTLLVNARLAPTTENLGRLEQQVAQPPAPGQSGSRVIRQGWAIATAWTPTRGLAERDTSHWPGWIEELPGQAGTTCCEGDFQLLDYPHHVISANLAAFPENLKRRLATGAYREYQPNVWVGERVAISPQVVFDTDPGPVVIDDDVRIGPFSYFRGPVYIGPRSRISEHASIKDGVSVSHTCKIGGEVEGTILEPYSNKQHHGFLGHSYLGSWINLGAGTCNSDLKNTYGTVNMDYGGHKVATGMQFIGCIVGDYAKTAINTSIFTGKTIGAASMVYGFATTNVPSFVNYARTFDEYGTLPPEVVVTTQQRMFARRNVEQRPCDIQLVHDMYRLTADERPDGLSGKPLAL